jgi:hypothetical protein
MRWLLAGQAHTSVERTSPRGPSVKPGESRAWDERPMVPAATRERSGEAAASPAVVPAGLPAVPRPGGRRDRHTRVPRLEPCPLHARAVERSRLPEAVARACVGEVRHTGSGTRDPQAGPPWFADLRRPRGPRARMWLCSRLRSRLGVEQPRGPARWSLLAGREPHRSATVPVRAGVLPRRPSQPSPARPCGERVGRSTWNPASRARDDRIPTGRTIPEAGLRGAPRTSQGSMLRPRRDAEDRAGREGSRPTGTARRRPSRTVSARWSVVGRTARSRQRRSWVVPRGTSACRSAWNDHRRRPERRRGARAASGNPDARRRGIRLRGTHPRGSLRGPQGRAGGIAGRGGAAPSHRSRAVRGGGGGGGGAVGARCSLAGSDARGRCGSR